MGIFVTIGPLPETRLEWFVLVVGVCAIGVLAFLIVDAKRHSPGAHRSARGTATTAAFAQSRLATTTAGPAASLTPAALTPRRRPRVVLTAAKGDCWLLARRGSSTGAVLFVGTLRRGTSRSFAVERLWLRLGASANIVARLNGSPLELPQGTPTVEVTTQGVRTLSLG